MLKIICAIALVATFAYANTEFRKGFAADACSESYNGVARYSTSCRAIPFLAFGACTHCASPNGPCARGLVNCNHKDVCRQRETDDTFPFPGPLFYCRALNLPCVWFKRITRDAVRNITDAEFAQEREEMAEDLWSGMKVTHSFGTLSTDKNVAELAKRESEARGAANFLRVKSNNGIGLFQRICFATERVLRHGAYRMYKILIRCQTRNNKLVGGAIANHCYEGDEASSPGSDGEAEETGEELCDKKTAACFAHPNDQWEMSGFPVYKFFVKIRMEALYNTVSQQCPCSDSSYVKFLREMAEKFHGVTAPICSGTDNKNYGNLADFKSALIEARPQKLLTGTFPFDK